MTVQPTGSTKSSRTPSSEDRGLIVNPTDDLKLECFCDADFAGLWGAEDEQDPICVRSRTGYVITIGGAPVLWTSKLQTEIAVSTMHAEYIALSQSMRDLLPTKGLLQEVAHSLEIEHDKVAQVSKVWEDNNGALKLANTELPIATPSLKFFAIKYHWFRSHVKEGELEVLAIDTAVQKGDLFTKGLPESDFRSKRKMLMGW